MKTIKILGKFIGILLLLFCILLPVSFCLKLWSKRLLLAEYVPVSFSESTKELQNPYIGWYTLRGYYLSEENEPNLSSLPSISDQPGLTLLEINLHAYQNQPIGEKGLLQLKRILEAWKRSGSQLILRFVYDWDGKGEENEPEELHTILTHMEQTIPIVNDYKDCVYLLQGIFVGSYGEMHGTKFMDREDMLTLISTLDNLADPAIYLSVRTPAQLRTILAAQGSSAPSTSSTASTVAAKSPAETASSSVNSSADTKVQDETASASFSSKPATATSSLAARLGLFNDGILGSESDTGTYGTLPPSQTDYTSAWNRTDELFFQDTLCAGVPNGGEVILENPLNDFPACLDALRTMHISYLNSAYDGAVLEKWKESNCAASTDPLYQGISGYDYIGQHMGYRYVIQDMTLSFQPLKEENLTLSLTLNNTGFSAAYRDFSWTVTLAAEDGSLHSFPLSLSSKALQPGEPFSVSFSVPARNLSEGTYSLYLSCYDPHLDREILLASDTEHTLLGYTLGTLSCSKLHSLKELLSLFTNSFQNP